MIFIIFKCISLNLTSLSFSINIRICWWDSVGGTFKTRDVSTRGRAYKDANRGISEVHNRSHLLNFFFLLDSIVAFPISQHILARIFLQFFMYPSWPFHFLRVESTMLREQQDREYRESADADRRERLRREEVSIQFRVNYLTSVKHSIVH